MGNRSLDLPGRGNRRAFVRGLRAGGDGNRKDQVMGGTERENTERDYWKEGGIWGSGKNLVQGNLPEVYKDDPS